MSLRSVNLILNLVMLWLAIVRAYLLLMMNGICICILRTFFVALNPFANWEKDCWSDYERLFSLGLFMYFGADLVIGVSSF